MEKEKFNSKLRSFVKENISITVCNDKKCYKCDRCFVTSVYYSFKTVLNQNCIQIGSYPRYTAIRPLHDLDILYILGNWNEKSHNPQRILEELLNKIKNEYSNPTYYKLEISLQTHSITIAFKQNNEEKFSVDIVPTYIFSKNEFEQDIYKVPEIVKKIHGKKRTKFYEKLSEEHKEMDWIDTDPRGYIEIAKRVNQENSDFRKTVKFIKAWKNLCKNRYENFKLKSFHIEQVITKNFQEQDDLKIFDAIFNFFVDLPKIIKHPKIKDRANNYKYIDDYLNDLTYAQKQKIIEARDGFLIKLEKLSDIDLLDNLIQPNFYKRASDPEQYLFDFNIPTLIEDSSFFKINGEVQEKKGGFRKYILDKLGVINVDRKIKFRPKNQPLYIDLLKWKVKNDDNSRQPRGEITDHQTLNDPENTKFKGNHYVECFAILNNICVAKARQNVRL